MDWNDLLDNGEFQSYSIFYVGQCYWYFVFLLPYFLVPFHPQPPTLIVLLMFWNRKTKPIS